MFSSAGPRGSSPWFPHGQPEPLVLASASPRRKDLLEQIGLRFIQQAGAADESWPEGMGLGDGIAEIALRKACSVAEHFGDAVVLGADTAVIVDGEPLGKPVSEDDAVSMLKRIVGRTHEVVTGIAFVDTRLGQQRVDAEQTEVTMRDAEESELRSYVSTGEPMDKAGAYGIQGLGAGLVTRIGGCYFNVVGLPLSKTLFHLQRIMDNRELSNV